MKKLIAAAFITALALTGCSSTATVEKPAAQQETATEPEAPAATKEGTRENPLPLGTAVTDGDWTVTINSVTLDGTQAVIDANMFNEAPAEGNQYLVANVTATYNGDDAEGSIPLMILEYVTADGNTINSYDVMAIPAEQFDSLATLYNGASTTGNIAFSIPSATAADGTLALKAHMLSDKVFVAVQ